MSTASTTRNRPAHLHATLLVGLCLLLFFAGLGAGFLWDIDEGMHAATSKDMVTSGDWIRPTFNGEAFYDKPPLFNWLVGVAFLTLGFTEFAARLPSALLGMGGVLVTYFFGARMFDARAAFLGAVVLATSVEYILLSRAVVHDMTLAFFVTLTLFSFYRAYMDEKHRSRFLMICYASAGFAVLAKGPLGAVLPGGVILLFLATQRNPGFIRKMRLVRGALIATVIAAPWYLLVGLSDSSFFGSFLLRQNLGYFFSSESRHAQPHYYYLPVILLGMLPWSFYLLFALLRWVRRPGRGGAPSYFIACWLGLGFVFFSVASSKLPTYLLPLFPPAALFVGHLWVRVVNDPGRGLRLAVLCCHAAGVVVALSAVFYLWFRVRPDPEIGPKLPISAVNIVTAAIVSGVFLTSALAIAGRWRGLFGAHVALVSIAVLYFAFFVAPGLNAYRSSKVAALEYDRLLAPGQRMTFYRWVRDSALFYTDRKATLIRSENELERYLGTAGALCMIEERRLNELDNLAAVRRASRLVYQHGNKLILQGRGSAAVATEFEHEGSRP